MFVNGELKLMRKRKKSCVDSVPGLSFVLCLIV